MRSVILKTYARWTVLCALREGPIRSRHDVYGALAQIEFDSVLNGALDPIAQAGFDTWHSQAVLCLMGHEPRLMNQYGWAAKMLNIYLKTCAYVGDLGRPNLRAVLHPPVDRGLWDGIRQLFEDRPDILERTHCVESIREITDIQIYRSIIDGLRDVAGELNCALIEVEQLWLGAAAA